mgnify:CR=1 FL=1
MRIFAPHVIRTKIIPPPRRARTLARPRVSQSLQQAFDYRLTLLQAGAGYGKSTALAELATEVQPLIWYQVNEEESDPLVLLLHICYAIQQALPAIDDLPIAVIEAWDGDQGPLPWRGLLDQIINALSRGLVAPTLLVLDRVAATFQVTIEELVAAPKEIGRKYPRGSLEVRERSGVRVEKLLPDPIAGMEIDRFILPARARMVGVPHTDGTREYLACDRGRVELVASGERFQLQPGDLVVFRGDQKHSYANIGEREAVCYSVVVLAR